MLRIVGHLYNVGYLSIDLINNKVSRNNLTNSRKSNHLGTVFDESRYG